MGGGLGQGGPESGMAAAPFSGARYSVAGVESNGSDVRRKGAVPTAQAGRASAWLRRGTGIATGAIGDNASGGPGRP